MDVQTAVKIITSSTSARDAIERMNLPRCRLHALLTSRAFIRTMEDYRIVTRALVTIRAGQFAGYMMGNLANLTNGDNEDSARKAAMAGLSQAMDGHIRPGPGRPAKPPTPPAPGATPSYSKVCPMNLPSQESHEASKPAPPTAAHALEYQGVAPGDLRQNILNFIHNAPPTPDGPPAGPVSIDKDRQIPTETHSPFLANTLQNKELQLSGHHEKLDPPACAAVAATAWRRPAGSPISPSASGQILE